MANPKTASNRRQREFRDAQRLAGKEKTEREKRELLLEAYASSGLGGSTATALAIQQQMEQVQLELQRRLNQSWYSGAIPSSYGFLNPVPFEAPERVPAVDLTKLESLKTAEPYKVTKRQPDYMEVITGWRAWKVSGQRLCALGYYDTWKPLKAIDASCDRGGHEAPQMDCACGVWAFKDLDRLIGALDTYSNIRVLGKVSLWGRVVETENGFRAEHAYPAELWLLDDSLEELGLIYDVRSSSQGVEQGKVVVTD